MPPMARILERAGMKEFIKNADAEQNEEAIGFDMMFHLLKCADKIADDACLVVSIIDGKTIQEVEEQDIFDTLETVGEVLGDERIMGFFGKAMQ